MDLITLTNIIIVIAILFFMYTGYRQGFLLKLISIFSFFVIGFIAWYLSQPLSNLIALYPKQALPTLEIEGIDLLLYNSLNRICVFIAFFVILLCIFMIMRPIFRFLNHVPIVSGVNKIAGCLLGGIQAVLIFFLVTMILRFPNWEVGNYIASTSYLRYCESLSKIVLFYVEEPIEQLQKIKDSIDDKEAFTQNEVDTIYAWLLKQNIEKESAEEILSKLRK